MKETDRKQKNVDSVNCGGKEFPFDAFHGTLSYLLYSLLQAACRSDIFLSKC